MGKRILLFSAVNILIVLSITIILTILKLDQMGPGLFGLLIFCLFWGSLGSFISLLLSKWMAKKMMGIQIVTAMGPHSDLVNMVHRLSRRAGLTEMPEVGIYQSSELNAFATGPSKDNSLVAVSSGLLLKMNADELEGVIAHEVSHIANGDMVTMSLLQGIMNAFVMFFARVVAMIIDQQMRDNDRNGRGLGYVAHYFIVMILQMIFGIFASIVINWFSRYREFRADEGGAKLASKEKMIAALKCLERHFNDKNENQVREVEFEDNTIRALQISGKEGLMLLFSTHPPLDQRIEALSKL